jgi:RimJ/RimL family protein N-acetyltransferase
MTSSGRVALRPATEGDVPFLSALAADSSVEPFLMPGAGDPEDLHALITRDGAEEGFLGLLVIESSRGARVGGLALQVRFQRSRMCELSRLMVSPEWRRAGVASGAVRLACRRALIDRGMHRVQAEVYGDNIAAQRLFERVGFVREGTRRSAYWRGERWLDGVLYGLLAEELTPRAGPPASRRARRQSAP